ncbi:MAG: signal peptidase I [Candidatus Dormibacteraeota bacterium]|nr:signal peptidase I [Candidatus Dormibacteraeota bacterium]
MRRLLIEFLEVVVLAAVLFLAVHFALQPVVVSGPSMYPTVATNQYLVALKFPYYLHSPGRGDVVILKSPYNPDTDFIKRVIGLPGETVLIKNGTVYINGTVLCEPYLRPDRDGAWTVNANWPADGRPYHLGSTQYFVMGDNRNVSEDSRTFGPVPRSSILAEAWLRVYPPGAFGGVDRQRGHLLSGPGSSAADCPSGG